MTQQDQRQVPDLFVLLLAAISSWPQPPRIVVNHISEDDLLSLHIHAKLNLYVKETILKIVKQLQKGSLRKSVPTRRAD